MVTVGTERVNQLRFHQAGSRTQALPGDSFRQNVDNALNFQLLGGCSLSTHGLLNGLSLAVSVQPNTNGSRSSLVNDVLFQIIQKNATK
jgi:hypothetical protein